MRFIKRPRLRLQRLD